MTKQQSDALMKLWHAVYLHPRKMGVKLFGRRRGATTQAQAIGALAANKATAISGRLSGSIRSAQTYEAIVDSIYDRSDPATKDMWDSIEASSARAIMELL